MATEDEEYMERFVAEGEKYMEKSVYDTNENGIVDEAENINGGSWS